MKIRNEIKIRNEMKLEMKKEKSQLKPQKYKGL